MVYFKDPQEWIHQSTLLLEARPSTARITTKYSLPRSSKETPSAQPTATQPSAKPATLTLKTFDPISGVCLKFKTEKAADVGRLMAGLGRCARTMAAAPPKKETSGSEGGVEVEKMDVDGEEEKEKVKVEGVMKEKQKEEGTEIGVGKEAKGKGGKGGSGGGGAGGKKKNKGKR